MGISGLLPLLKSIHRPTELKKYAGETFGIDGYGWLHRGAVACAIELAQGKPTRKYVDFAMHRVRMFKYFGVTPYLVFDGDFLPSKAKTEASRAKRREESKRIGLELLRAGKPSQAYAELQKAIDVTPEMARHLIEELKKAEVPYVVAPYEADAQLVYLERHGFISGIVSEDSDLLVFGAKRLLTKMDQHGQCVEINRNDFCRVREISLTGWTDVEFRHMAIFSGCDYLDGVNNIGLKTAYRLIRKHKTPERVIKMLRFDGKHQIPESYLDNFKQAELTFLHQRVFCPKKQDIVLLAEPEPSVNVDDMPFIGAPVETETARSIAAGDINPITRERIVVPVPRSPGKRRISQALAPVNGPARSLGKPINEYFKDKSARRIPLGEMDANCFGIDLDNNATTPSDAPPRPIVFPLPRPYLDTAEEPESPARPYTSNARVLRRRSEPISKLLGLDQFGSSGNRRQTAGPAFEVYQDPTSSMRPPKKARLCEDSTADGTATATAERSKFFPAKKQTKPARQREDQLLMSDDSVEEAFRSLPDLDSWRSDNPLKPTDVIDTSKQSSSPEKETEIALTPPPATANHDHAIPDDQVEVPASSPLQQQQQQQHGLGNNGSKSVHRTRSITTAVTPLGELLKDFSYATSSSSQPRLRNTRLVHGLPTPASTCTSTTISSTSSRRSVQRTTAPMATPKSTAGPPQSGITALLTPLQRMGARAMHRKGTATDAVRGMSTPGGLGARICGGGGGEGVGRLKKGMPPPPVDPALVPLPRVDVEEVEALNRPWGSEDLIVPESDGDGEGEGEDGVGGGGGGGRVGRLDLSKFLYS